MGSMESLEAHSELVSSKHNENEEDSCSDTDIIIPVSDQKPQDVKVEAVKMEIEQVKVEAEQI